MELLQRTVDGILNSTAESCVILILFLSKLQRRNSVQDPSQRPLGLRTSVPLPEGLAWFEGKTWNARKNGKTIKKSFINISFNTLWMWGERHRVHDCIFYELTRDPSLLIEGTLLIINWPSVTLYGELSSLQPPLPASPSSSESICFAPTVICT